MKKILVDVSSILGQYMHIKDEEYGTDINCDGTMIHIPHHDTLMERAEGNFQTILDRLGLGPESLIMVRDPEKPGEARKKKFPDYKAGRQKRPRAFYETFNKFVDSFCEEVMKSGGITATPRVAPTVEADDLINELAMRLPDTIIVSADKDLLSCPAGAHYIGGELNPIKYPVPNNYIKLYRCLVSGDKSDNIPSCPGFGPAAWDKMFALIGPEGIAELWDIIEKKELHLLDGLSFPKAGLLIENIDTIYKAWDLMSFLHVPAHKIKWEARCPEADSVLVTADNFDTVLAAVKRELTTAEHAVIDFETDTPIESDAWLAGTYDPETGKQAVQVDVIASEPTGMSLKVGSSVYYFSVDHKDTRNIKLSDLQKVIDLLRDKVVIAQNAVGFENVILYKHFGGFLPLMKDSKIAASYVDENNPTGLKTLSKRWLEYEQETYSQVINGRRGMRDVTGEEVLSYGCDDALTTDALWNLFTVIMQYEGTYETFLEVESDAGFVTSLAFINGIEFDDEVHTRLRSENVKKIDELKKVIKTSLLRFNVKAGQCPKWELVTVDVVRTLYKSVTGNELKSKARSVKGLIADIDVESVKNAVIDGADAVNSLIAGYWEPDVQLNTRSPKQMQELLYSTLGCPVRIRNAATDNMRAKGKFEGTPATSEDAIANAIAFKDTDEDGVALLQSILDLKGCLTKESLFFRKLPSLVHWQTGRIHGSMIQCGTSTRRFTHSTPNHAQSSKKKGKEMRDMFKAPDGYVLVSLDYSGQELRLQAWHCQDKNFLACYQGPPENRKDIHSQMGFTISSKSDEPLASSYEEFKKLIDDGDAEAKKTRAVGKAVVFSSAYGCRPKKLATILRTTEAEATKYLEAKSEAFPGFDKAVKEWNDLCQSRGYSLTMMGARRHLAKQFAMAKSQGDIDAVRRLAYSFVIQSSGAEMAKMTMGRLWRSGVFEDSKCSVFSVIHDEIVGVIREDLLQEMIPIWHECMVAKYADMEIDLESTPEVGTHFGSLKKFDLDNKN